MGSMFFGQYLLSKGAINRDALIDAIERQRSTNLSLVELAVPSSLDVQSRFKPAIGLPRPVSRNSVSRSDSSVAKSSTSSAVSKTRIG